MIWNININKFMFEKNINPLPPPHFFFLLASLATVLFSIFFRPASLALNYKIIALCPT